MSYVRLGAFVGIKKPPLQGGGGFGEYIQN